MTFLTIVERELRMGARRLATYRARVGVALLAMLAAFWGTGMSPLLGYAGLSHEIFSKVAGFAFILCALAGVRLTADCISREKRDGTLGLLFLTDLRGHDVVLGKLAATSLTSAYSTLAALPVIALAFIFGGMVPAELARMAVVLGNTLLFSLAAGLFVSSFSYGQTRATGLTLLIVLGFTVGIQGVGMIVAAWQHAPMPAIFGWLSQAWAFDLAFQARYAMMSVDFWIATTLTFSLSLALLVFAAMITPRTWQEKPQTQKKPNWRARWQQWAYGPAAARARFRARLLEVNPVFWLVARNRFKPFYVWAVVALPLAAWCGGQWWMYGRPRIMFQPFVCLTTLFALHTALKIWVALEAARRLADDRRSGALELLLATRLTDAEIVRGVFRALYRQFLWPVLFVLALDLTVMMISKLNWGWHEDARLMVLSSLIVFVVDLYAIAWTSIWLGLKMQNSMRATLGAMGRILVGPGVLIVFFGSFGAASHLSAVALSYLTITLIVDAVIGAGAADNISVFFRLLAANPSVKLSVLDATIGRAQKRELTFVPEAG